MDAIPTTMSYLSNQNYVFLTLVIAILIALYYYVETSEAVRMVKKLPGPFAVPIIGHVLLTLRLSPDYLLSKAMEYHEIYGSVAGAYFGTKAFVFLTDPQDIEVILGSSVHIDKSTEYQLFKPWLGDGLLINAGDKWRRHRKIIAPTFHMSILKAFVPYFYKNTIEFVKRFRNEIGKEFDCHDYMSALSVDILTETAMGVKVEKKNTGYEYADAVMKLCNILHRRHYDISLRLDMFFKYSSLAKVQEKMLKVIHGISNHIIEEKSKDIDEKCRNNKQQNNGKSEQTLNAITNNNENVTNYTKLHYVRDDLDDIDENDVGDRKRTAFLQTMLDLNKNGEQMTAEEVRDEVNTIMFEGHDTTAAGSSFVLCVLGAHQDIQARVYQELEEIFGDSDRQCTFQDTIEMKYLERVILETLRLFPPVPLIARNLNENVKIVTGNYVLPKSATVLIVPFGLHRTEKYYPNALDFNPDNFLPEKMQQRHYYSFIPFSAGPRSCVGRKYAMLMLKVLLSTILRNYRIVSDIPDQNFRLQADIILKRSDGFKIKIEPRERVFKKTPEKTNLNIPVLT